jgi:WhiB family redox-sensing transcriptional regulator
MAEIGKQPTTRRTKPPGSSKTKSNTRQQSPTPVVTTPHLSPADLRALANTLRSPSSLINKAIQIAVGSGPEDGWWYASACWEKDTSLFFPERGQSATPGKTICSKCSVRADCLAAALLMNERFGIWGGLTERQRRLLRKTLASAGILKIIKQGDGDTLTTFLIDLGREAKDYERYAKHSEARHPSKNSKGRGTPR